jgi:pimeloyl-ACP methyl ester carboxylesterase
MVTQRKFKIIGVVIGSTVLLYLLVASYFYFFPDQFVFQSERLPQNHVYTFDQEFREYTIRTTDGETLNALLFSPQDSSRGLILYFHGNAGNLQRWGEYAVDFTSLGYDVLMTDYRGYGKST